MINKKKVKTLTKISRRFCIDKQKLNNFTKNSKNYCKSFDIYG